MEAVKASRSKMEEKFRDFGKQVDRMIERVRGLTDEELEPAVRAEVEVWRSLVDDLRVQATLGKMEARERVEPLVDRVTEAVAGLRHRLDGIFDVDEGEELESSLVDSFKSLRDEILKAEELQ